MDENDKTYKNAVKKIRKVNTKIEKLYAGLQKAENIFIYLSEIIENIDTLLTDVKVIE